MRDSLFHCPVILNIFTRVKFIELRRCFHVTNVDGLQRQDLGYDKIDQTRWLVNCIREWCKLAWCVQKQLRDDDTLQGNVLSYPPVHAKEAPEMGIEGVVFGLFCFEVCLELRNLLWKRERHRSSSSITCSTTWRVIS